MDGRITEEEWTGKKVNYSFLKNFGCEAFLHIDKENRTKLEEKSKKCTFIRYGINDFGYLLWDYENNKIIRSRDVIFNEKVMYKDQLQGKKQEEEKQEYALFSMGIWRKSFICSSHRGMRSKGMRIWYAG